MHLRPKRMREAAALWERIGLEDGDDARDTRWSHPDLLPVMPTDDDRSIASAPDDTEVDARPANTDASSGDDGTTGIDWDAELSKLLDEGLSGDGDPSGNEPSDNYDN